MKLDIALLAPGLPFDGDTLTTRSLGGSETAALCLARELVGLGNRVLLFNNRPEPGAWDGVRYFPLTSFDQYARCTPHDVLICQRALEPFVNRLTSRLNVLWCHDLALARQFKQFNGVLWNIDKVAVVSPFMADQYAQVYGLDEQDLYVTRNGIDLSLFEGVDEVEREPARLIYTARPERGLDVMLGQILPRILEKRPDVTLAIGGYDNQVVHLRDFYAQIGARIDAFGDRVEWLGHMAKPELYREYAKAALYVYPMPSPSMRDFAETYCTTVDECMAAGLPFVSTRLGALPTTLAEGAGRLVDLKDAPGAWPEGDVEIFTAAVLDLLEDALARADMGEAGKAAAQSRGWDGIGAEWQEAMERWIDERNDDPVRLAHHFLRRSDVVAAKASLSGDHDEKRTAPLLARVASEYAWVESDAAFREHYSNPCDQVEFEARLPQRGQQVLDRLIEWGVKSVLDVGCAHGSLIINMANALPGVRFTAVDLDADNIRVAKGHQRRHLRKGSFVDFRQGDETALGRRRFDAVFAGEVTEHQVEPWTFLERLQAAVKPGGHVIITVPWGPWEQDSYRSDPRRWHLWEFDHHDIQDMLGAQVALDVDSYAHALSRVSGEPMGYYAISWKVTGKPVRPIDMARKLRLQRPRQTLSASLICGGARAEEHLLGCLRSVCEVADEVVIGDTGMSELAKTMAATVGARIVPAPNPLKHGFDEARNASLDACTMDWVLIIDTDEQLNNPHTVTPYLRQNRYHGYAVHQHHAAVDVQLATDTPIRLFRRAPTRDGKVMRVVGRIHEHAELGVNQGPGRIIAPADLHLYHPGYVNEATRRERFQRNLPLLEMDQRDYPERLLQKHFLCRDLIQLSGHELQQNGGVVTPEIEARCKQVVALVRKYFLGQTLNKHVDPLFYYSKALQILGQGIDVEFSIKAARDGVGDKLNGSHYRFADTAEAIQEISARAKAALADYEHERWW